MSETETKIIDIIDLALKIYVKICRFGDRRKRIDLVSEVIRIIIHSIPLGG